MTQPSQQPCMLLFTIGPVQSFIAQARKTRDLWLGSYLLSVLMEAAMKGMNNVLVFPANPHIEGKIPDLPNKYIAIFDDRVKAREAAEASEKRIRSSWEQICGDVWNKIVQGTPSNKQTEAIWKRQINPDRFFEVFWVVVEGDRSNYATWLTETQIALAARKRSRHIKWKNSIEEEVLEEGEKSTISGDREALRSVSMDRNGVRKFWQQLIDEHELSPFDINPSGEERLDAIDTVKRFAYRSRILREKLKEDRVGFPSTSSIATASFVEQLLIRDENAISLFIQEWMKVTQRNHLAEMPTDTIPYLSEKAKDNSDLLNILKRDGDCYFPETFVSRRLEKDYGIPQTESGSTASQGQRALKDMLRDAAKLGITRPTPYYAMIQMDGDKMGVLLGSVNKKNGEGEHRDISTALSTFSRSSAKALVEEQYPGRLIYAGGDDVFALAPLARDSVSGEEPLTVLQLVDKLQYQYHGIVSQAVQDGKRQKTVTASAGIAIAHHYTSLSYVRRMSKAAEDAAKKVYGRNSLVVTILRRSGEQTRVGCRWAYNGYTMKEKAKDGTEPAKVPMHPIDIFSEFYRLFKEDKLSPKCVYILLEESPALVHPSLFLPKDPSGEISDAEWEEMAKNIRAMQESEIKRVLRRQRNSKDENAGLTDNDTERLAHNLVELAKAMDKDGRKSIDNEEPVEPKEKIRAIDLHSEDRRYGLVEVLGWLQVMVFLTRKEQE